MDNSRQNHREILIRYGRLAPHAQDRILDQFYLILPGSMALQGFLVTQAFSLIVGSIGLALLVSALLMCFGARQSLYESLYFCFGLEGVWVFFVMHFNYVKRYREKPFDTTEIGLSNEGVRLHSRNSHGGMILDSFRWDDISSVNFIEGVANATKNKSRDKIIISDTRKHRAEIFLDCLQTIEERNMLRAVIEKNVKQIDTRTATSALTRTGKSADIPFTKLWSQALRDSKPRLHTSALSTDYQLQNGRFKISNLIGGGGQGAVYAAESRDLQTDGNVILKEYVLPDIVHEIEHKNACEQFEKEVHLLSKLNHPGIVKMFDAFVEDHRAYLVMELVEGRNLKEEIQECGAMSCKRTLALCQKMTDILENLHTTKPVIMHLDFSPENLMLGANDKITVLDFNISSEENSMRTRTVMGKQRYMAPEQYRGKPSVRSDIYALGATLYFLLTGREPEPITVAKCKKNSDNPETIPDSVDAFVSKATALDEAERYQSISIMNNELLKLIDALGAENENV